MNTNFPTLCLRLFSVAILLSLPSIGNAGASPVSSAALDFESETIDLETGEECQMDFGTACNNFDDSSPRAPNDLKFAFNSGRTNPAVLFQRQVCAPGEVLPLAEIAFLDGTDFGLVSAAAIGSATFTTALVDQPFDPDDTVILHTCEGNYFKIGNAACNAGNPATYPDCQDASTPVNSVAFDYQRLGSSAALDFESETIDLETGEECQMDFGTACNNFDDSSPRAPNDLNFAFNSGRTNPAVLFQRQVCAPGEVLPLAEIAFLDGTDFDFVGAALIGSATFTTALVDQPFDPDDTIILHTCEGNYFKIGNAACNAGNPATYPDCQDASTPVNSVAFDYQRLEPISAATLDFEFETIDLETGEECQIEPGSTCNSDPFGASAPNDLTFAFNSGRTNPAVLFQRQVCAPGEVLPQAEIAFLDGTDFDFVGAALIGSATFTTALVDQPFDPDDTIILHTCEGNYFKIGNAACNAGNPATYPDCQDASTPVGSVAFDYQRLEPIVDTDGDGIVDDCDNCLEVANADQRDTNGDGYGNICDADLNNDLIVNAIDLGLFKIVFFTPDPDADFNGNGVVNAVDLGIFKTYFFLPPGPSGVAP